MFEFNRYIPIAKVDEEERMVYGFASTPDLDSDGEVISLAGLKKALPSYLQYPTLREMHQPKAAGTVKNAEIKKGDEKGLYIGAKVVADDAWNLVKEGVYRAFSIGGNVLTKVENVITDLELVEISLVDVPANKKARIDVWKSGKITKDAETVYSLANLMITLKDTINYFEAIEKPTKNLTKALEMIKKVIGEEAGESEKDSQERWDAMFLSDNPEDITKIVKSLDRISFDEGSVPEILRKAVKIQMLEKLKKNEDVETPEVEVEVPEVEEVEDTPESPEVETPTEEVETEEVEEVADEDAEAETEESDEDDAEKSETPEFKKLDDVADRLEKLEKVVTPEVVKVDGESLSKVASSLEKMLSIVEKLEKRIANLEDQPSPLKSKKYVEVKRETETTEKVDANPEVAKKEARLVELDTIFEKVGPSQFAKMGYSLEAGKLKDEIARLKA